MAGYPKLAQLMDREPETAIVRRFGRLNMLNILRLQAEIQDMERELDQILEEDAKSGDAIRESYTKDFRLMRDWREAGDSEQYDLLVNIGSRLQEYNDFVSQDLVLSKAESPSVRELAFLQKWLIRPGMGDQFLNDVERTTWDSSNAPDLISLSGAVQGKDHVSKFIYGVLLDFHHRIWGNTGVSSHELHLDKGIRKYRNTRLLWLSNTINAALSSLRPTVMILVLYFVKRMLVRIGLVIVFTAIFSLALSTFIKATKIENFSATAAFAAVEVVFIGSTSTNSTA
ncbi:hypothetical protein LTR84_002145 [Exophiala bonariae]|uniref:DUF6594 domain-containing protein n=1 Tax=Exophiala bonariae TaxID=1690606 RepID=A0AAV9NAK8_9EURO|nr:hypothetical protein LTR84_002145 [Exophiala bonariae]